MTDNDIVRIPANLIEESIVHSGDTAWDKSEFVRIRKLQLGNRVEVGNKFICFLLVLYAYFLV